MMNGFLVSYGDASEQNWYWALWCTGCFVMVTMQVRRVRGAGTIGHELITRIPNNDARKATFYH